VKINYRLGLALASGAARGAFAVITLKAQVKLPVYVVIDIAEMAAATACAIVAAASSPKKVASVGGRYIVRGATPKALDGSPPPSRFVVLGFDNEAPVEAWQNLASTR
jgi:uncharacterized protein (DUF1330 family)